MSRVVVVTGAASGIGLALAEQLAGGGTDVVALDRNTCPVPGVRTVPCDLADSESIESAVAQLPAEIHALANVAGVPGTAPARTVLAVNVLAPILLVEGVLPRLSAGAAIVNVASVAAHRNTLSREALDELLATRTPHELEHWLRDHPIEGPAAYDTSKRALVDWTARLAAELLAREIRAVSVSPGPVETPILADFARSMGAESMELSLGIVGRHGTPAEIAAVIAFALSPAASWLNGIDIPVEGGLLAARTPAQFTALKGTPA